MATRDVRADASGPWYRDIWIPVLKIGRLLAVSVFGVTMALITVGPAIKVNRGIDAHRVQTSGTVVDRTDDMYIVEYSYELRSLRAELSRIRGPSAVGNEVCLEIDATRPEHARACGTRGELDDVLLYGFGICGLALLISGTLLGVWVSAMSRGDRKRRAAAADYSRLVAELRRQITTGELPVGATLPGLADLARRHDVDEDSAEAALSQLFADAIVNWRLDAAGQAYEPFVQRCPVEGVAPAPAWQRPFQPTGGG